MRKKVFWGSGLLTLLLAATLLWIFNPTSVPENMTIFEAASNGTPKQIKALVHNGADINSIDENGCSVLMSAIRVPDNADNILTIIELGADVNQPYKIYWPIIFAANSQSDVRVLEALVKNGADVNQKMQGGLNAMVFAAMTQNNTDFLDFLIKKGADVNAQDEIMESVLNTAIYQDKSDNYAAIKVLIEQGANIETPNQHGKTPLVSAILKQRIDVIKLLLSKDVEVTNSVLNKTINDFDNVEMIGLLADKFDTLNFLDEGKWSPMIVAIMNKHPSIYVIMALAERGADANFAGEYDYTPLMLLMEREEDYVLEAPDDIHSAEFNSADELFLDLKRHNDEARIERKRITLALTHILLKLGADVNKKNEDGRTALDMAIATGKDPEILELLRNAQAKSEAN